MKKTFLLAAVAAVLGVTLYLSCNKSARHKFKKKLRGGCYSMNKGISKASQKIEKSVNKAVDNLSQVHESLHQKAEKLNSEIRNNI